MFFEKKVFLVSLCLLFVLQPSDAFVPADIIEKLFNRLISLGYTQTDFYSESFTHEDIIKYGIAQSIAEYYYNQPNGSLKINMTKANNEYYDIRNLYYDYYGVWMCDLKIDFLIDLVFKINVAVVDVDPSTRKLPYAHFDAERFEGSNNRVIDFRSRIFSFLSAKNYEEARELSGQVLHTVQDFYSHSNWVEAGNTDINYDIGFSNFSNQAVVAFNESNTCSANCTLVTVTCSTFLDLLTQLINFFKLSFLNSFSCPVKYYKCDNNILVMNKLVSGYAADQALSDGTAVNKPSNIGKCSHGGIFDSTASNPAEGGINKDSGLYILSPHANLHKQAAGIAIKHTKFFFEDIRKTIGDSEYANFLKLIPSSEELAKGKTSFYKCASLKLISSMKLQLLLLITLLVFKKIF